MVWCIALRFALSSVDCGESRQKESQRESESETRVKSRGVASSAADRVGSCFRLSAENPNQLQPGPIRLGLAFFFGCQPKKRDRLAWQTCTLGRVVDPKTGSKTRREGQLNNGDLALVSRSGQGFGTAAEV